MMKRKKSIILIIISLVLIAIVGIISYNLSRKEISIQQIQGSATSTANADTTTTNYTLTFVNRDMTIVLNATNSDTLQSKYEEAEQKFNDTYTNPFATYIENGHKYVF